MTPFYYIILCNIHGLKQAVKGSFRDVHITLLFSASNGNKALIEKGPSNTQGHSPILRNTRIRYIIKCTEKRHASDRKSQMAKVIY